MTTIIASAAAIRAAEEVLKCQQKWPGKRWSMCWNGQHRITPWTDRGCPVAVAIADAVATVVIQDIEELISRN